MCFEVRDKRGWPVTPRSPDLAQVHCEALGKGLWDGDPGPLTHTHPRALPFMCAPLHVAPQLPLIQREQ